MEASEDEVEVLVLDGSSKGPRSVESIETDKDIVFQVDGAVGALSQGFTQHLAGPGRPGRDGYDFPAVFFLLAKGLFQGVGVRLVDLIRNVFANPGPGLVQLEGSIFLRNLLHADQNFHA